MINKDKLLILGTVPIAMTINLCLLSYFFGNQSEYHQQSVSQPKETINDNSTNSVHSEPTIQFATTRQKLKIAHFPEPPIHTFAGNESQEMSEEEENIKVKGVVIK